MREMFRRRHLPHWDVPGATHFVTACLADSIPAQGLLSIRNLERQLLARKAQDVLVDQQPDIWKRLFLEREKWLDISRQ